MSDSKNVYVTKLAAAERQLRAAIRLYFSDEDELAIHTIASAAYKLITDLKSKRGMEEASDKHRDLVFFTLRSYHRNELPEAVKNDPKAMKWIRELAERTPQIAATSTPDVINSVSVSADEIRGFWQSRTHVANYLKHADRDHGAHLSMGDVDNLKLISETYSSYIDLAANSLIPEGLASSIYLHVRSGDAHGFNGVYRGMADDLMEVSPDEARAKLSAYIAEMNKRLR